MNLTSGLFSFALPVYFLALATIFNTYFGHRQEFKTSAPVAVLDVSAGSNSPICSGTTLQLTSTVNNAAGPFTYVWSGPAGFSASIQNPTRANTMVSHSGTYNVTVTEIGSGMTGTASVSVSVSQAPTVNAGPDQDKCQGAPAVLNGSFTAPAGSATWAASTPGGNFQPNNMTLNAQYIPPPGFTGSITLTLTTDDPPGVCGPVSDNVVISWYDTDAAICNDVLNVALDEDCESIITPDMILEGDVPDPLFKVEIFAPNGASLGNVISGNYLNTTLTAKVTDTCNNNMCTATLIVTDEIPPLFTSCDSILLNCAITNFTPAYLKDVLGIDAAYPDVYENCGPFNLIYNDTWVTLGCNGSFNGVDDISGYVRRRWIATDLSGNLDSCTQFLYFKHTGIDDIQLPADITITNCQNPDTSVANTGAPFITVFDVNIPIYPDNGFCGVTSVYSDQSLPGCGGSKTYLRTWTIYDACAPTVQGQNPKLHTQAISIVDADGPVIDCPANTTVNMNPLDCCANVNLPDVIIYDLCSPIGDATVTIRAANGATLYNGDAVLAPVVSAFPNDTLAIFGTTPCLPMGTHTVTYTAEDECTKISSCTFSITVEDNIPPVAACDEITQVSLGSDGMILINAMTFDDGSYDNCGIVRFKARRKDANSCQQNNMFYDQVKMCCEDLGDTITVILRVYDIIVPAGNVSLTFGEDHANDCEVQVFVDDKIKPVCVPPANTTVSCENFDPSLWAYGTATGVDNCCVDTVTVMTNYQQFDTTCSRGTIIRTFRVSDCEGNTNQCTHRIVVNYEQDFYIKFPNDVVVTDCDGSGNYGQPTFFGEDCELLAVSHTDEVFTVVPDACIKVERTWTIINWCTYDPNDGFTYVPNPNPNFQPNHPTNLTGPTVSPQGTPAPWTPTVAKLNPNDPTPTNFSTYWNPNTNSYKYKQIIKIVDDVAPQFVQCPDTTIQYCDLTTNNPSLWNENYWFDPQLGINDLCEGPAPLTISAFDLCSKDNVNIRFLLFLDLDHNGTMETVISSTNPPTPGTVNYDNASNPNFSGGTIRNFDQRPVSLNQKYQWALQYATFGNIRTANLRWNTAAQPNTYVVPELPYGIHKIKWIIEDGCGNENVCEYTFEVKDCKAPSVTCVNGLSVNIGPDFNVTVHVPDFVVDAIDNCTPPNQIEFGIRKVGTGLNFPLDNNGNPVTFLDFGCWAVDTQDIEIWVRDAAGNADRCSTYVIVQDLSGFCPTNSPDHVTVAGSLLTEDVDGLEDGYVEIEGFHPTGPTFSYFQMTDNLGNFKFSNAIPMYGNYTITPTKDDNAVNGVTTYDLVLISQHILGLQPLGSPYKMIAADANRNGSITTADIVELRRLILGIVDELPNNTSWRFIDKSFNFPDMNNPFMTAFPETKTVSDIQSSSMDENFVAVKVGDVNSTSIPNSLMSIDERSNGNWYLDVLPEKDISVDAGEVFTVRFLSNQPMLGYQFTMLFPELDVLDVRTVRGVTEDHFGVFEKENAITGSWFGNQAVEFAVTFRARNAGDLRQMITISNRITKSEAYSPEGDKLEVVLRYQQQEGDAVYVGVGFELYQNIPNPFINKTVIGFNLPQACEATLTVYDEMSRVIHTESGHFSKGYNTLAIESSKLNSAGLLYYKVETATDSAVRTMIRVR